MKHLKYSWISAIIIGTLTMTFAMIFTGCMGTEIDQTKTSDSMNITSLEFPAGTVSPTAKAQNEYYISSTGSDKNPGTKELPFKTIYYARDVVRKYKDAISGDITVYLSGGMYRLFKTLEFTQDDSAKDGGKITYKAVPGETPILNGGIQVGGFKKTTVNGIRGVYKAKIEGVDHIRQFYAGTIPQPRAAVEEKLRWGWKNQNDRSSIKVYGIDLSKIKNQKQVEVLWPIEWKIFIQNIDAINGNEINFRQPSYDNLLSKMNEAKSGGGGTYYPNTSVQIYVQNDLSFLNNPGEWYFDENKKELYYYPPENIEMGKTDFFIPNLEEMITFDGQVDNKLKGVQFDGITFCNGAWNTPSESGLSVNQAESLINGQIPANISARNTDGLSFYNCIFETMGTTALGLESGIKNSVVQGCTFRNTSEAALTLNSSGPNAQGEEISDNNLIDNNVFHNIGLNYWSSPAICVLYARKTTISHNYIYDVPYTGISLGWGWYFTKDSTVSRNNVVEYNKIGKFMQKLRDGGGIYTLGQQPNSFVNNNYIFDQGAAFGGLYHDEGSAYFTTTNNVVQNYNSKNLKNISWIHVNGNPGGPNGGKTAYNLTIKNNFTDNPKTSFLGEPSTCVLSDNTCITGGKWPAEAKKIMDESGLESKYKLLLNEVK